MDGCAGGSDWRSGGGEQLGLRPGGMCHSGTCATFKLGSRVTAGENTTVLAQRSRLQSRRLTSALTCLLSTFRVRQPVKAVLMLFPITAAYEKMRKEEDARIEAEGGAQGLEDVLWFPQTSAFAFPLDDLGDAIFWFKGLTNLSSWKRLRDLRAHPRPR